MNSSAGSDSRFPSPSPTGFSRRALPVSASLSNPVWFRAPLAAAPGVATSAIGPRAPHAPRARPRAEPAQPHGWQTPPRSTAPRCSLLAQAVHLNCLSSKRFWALDSCHEHKILETLFVQSLVSAAGPEWATRRRCGEGNAR